MFSCWKTVKLKTIWEVWKGKKRKILIFFDFSLFFFYFSAFSFLHIFLFLLQNIHKITYKLKVKYRKNLHLSKIRVKFNMNVVKKKSKIYRKLNFFRVSSDFFVSFNSLINDSRFLDFLIKLNWIDWTFFLTFFLSLIKHRSNRESIEFSSWSCVRISNKEKKGQFNDDYEWL